MEYIKCPWCREDGFDLIGLKSHVLKSECEVFEATEMIHSPFDALTMFNKDDE